eukprot:CAMPEP_0194079424 /NCGR_PEP_ID=MMETSP0149-20130528/5640_1 /TAXON_ID=122233 /ORGANISM="Chaetoceros debilis, Strain MM31A-1" /LENGTH=304 /DNA_ID=CAMNT_0038760925 /DNA_START=162 /DNA_END=1076 /DNA_ORIENTATION=+
MKNVEKYLSRIGLDREDKPALPLDRATLALLMAGQSRCIAFENIDIVLKKTISISPSDVEKKLVDDQRGGYCWEHNTLLRMALEELGYKVMPVMCRVRWGQADDSDCEGPNTPFDHLALIVRIQTPPDGKSNCFLADVGFAGTNSIHPINLGIGDEQQNFPEGLFRVVTSKHDDFHVIELRVVKKKNTDPEVDEQEQEWRPLYEWREESAPWVDQECSNWYSCTYPTHLFTTSFFICKLVSTGDGDERHHISNDQYVIRKGYGVDKEVITEQIKERERLMYLVVEVFGINLDGVETEGIDRFLS